nr:MAG TPA: distal tail protein [Caudoviricetes sp.]
MVKINNVILPTNHYTLVDAGEIQVAKKRITEENKIYGANGTYVVSDGAYESQDRILKISAVDFDKVVELCNIFNDEDNEIEFNHVKSSKYYADLIDINYSKQGNRRWLVNIKLRYNPFRYLADDGLITLGANGTITNVGDIFSEPIIEIEGNGDVTLTIGNQSMDLKLELKAYIDCRQLKQNVYDRNKTLKNSIRKRGGFFEIQPGIQGVTTRGNVSRIRIKGNWRWRV